VDPGFFEQTLDEDQSFALCEVGKPGLHLACETLGLNRWGFLFLEKREQPSEVISLRRALWSRERVLQRTYPLARV